MDAESLTVNHIEINHGRFKEFVAIFCRSFIPSNVVRIYAFIERPGILKADTICGFCYYNAFLSSIILVHDAIMKGLKKRTLIIFWNR